MSLKDKAKEIISKSAFDFYRSGADDEFTLKLNKQAFKRIRIQPSILHGISQPNTKCKILNFDDEFGIPFGISPMGMQKMAHPDGEIAMAKAAGCSGCVFILSTVSTTSIEEIAKNAPNTHKWFQLYIYKDRSITENLIRRAEDAGFKAIVLTIDVPFLGIRRADIRNQFELPANLKLANFTGIQLTNVKNDVGKSGIGSYVSKQFDPTLTWKDVEWLVKFTKLPVILKGVLSEYDAVLAHQTGCQGIIVSNHGGRQLDGVPASIEVLPRIVKAVGDKITVMVDGGISQGTDVFKALALGAKFVFVGRSALWGLAVNGQKGVEDVLNDIKRQFESTMTLCGCKCLKEINSNFIVHESYYNKL